MTYTAQVISVGDELTSGQRLDTNCQWISRRLAELGIAVRKHVTVADDLATMTTAFSQAVDEFDIVVASGGLGPTADDLTRQVITQVAGVEEFLDESTLEHIRQLFEQRRREMPESNRVQAYFPRGCRIIPNPHGTAPGIDFTFKSARGSCRLFALPGVPAELQEMWEGYVAPQLLESHSSGATIRHLSIHCFGEGESQIENRLPDLIQRGRQPLVGITASKGTITLRITATAQSEADFLAQIQPTEELIRSRLGDLIFGINNDTLEDIVVRQLVANNQTLAVVDFGLNGTVAKWLCETELGGHACRGGWTLSDARDPLESARSARDLFQVDFVLVIGQLHVDQQDMSRKVWLIGLGQPQSTTFDCNCHPQLLQIRSGKQALNWLRLLLNQQGE